MNNKIELNEVEKIIVNFLMPKLEKYFKTKNDCNIYVDRLVTYLLSQKNSYLLRNHLTEKTMREKCLNELYSSLLNFVNAEMPIDGKSAFLYYRFKEDDKFPETNRLVFEGFPMFQGIKDMLYRFGVVKSLEVVAVREKDVIYKENFNVIHKYNPFDTPKMRGEIIGTLCKAKLNNDEVIFVEMRIDEILKAASYAKFESKKIWESFFEEMVKKTGLRRAMKELPQGICSPEIYNKISAIEKLDNSTYDFTQEPKNLERNNENSDIKAEELLEPKTIKMLEDRNLRELFEYHSGIKLELFTKKLGKQMYDDYKAGNIAPLPSKDLQDISNTDQKSIEVSLNSEPEPLPPIPEPDPEPEIIKAKPYTAEQFEENMKTINETVPTRDDVIKLLITSLKIKGIKGSVAFKALGITTEIPKGYLTNAMWEKLLDGISTIELYNYAKSI